MPWKKHVKIIHVCSGYFSDFIKVNLNVYNIIYIIKLIREKKSVII